jgi:NCAIR mutase (PurE)-related protein
MEVDALRTLLDAVAAGTTSPAAALDRLRHLPYEVVGHKGHPFARLDHHRGLRQSVPEVVYCPGKQPEQLVTIAERVVAATGRLLATRATDQQAEAVRARLPAAELHPLARTITIDGDDRPAPVGHIALLAAGTADLPVAEEVRIVAAWLGSRVEPIYDVGVAGLHRLLDHAAVLGEARVLVVVAGMDGVLPSVVGGLTDRPVVAVPTATGYGANFNGVVPLLTMLNACPPGIGVVNIGNGFGAACLAHRINLLGEART